MNFDRTFCRYPSCENKCGRKISQEEKDFLKKEASETGFYRPISMSYFCGEE